LEVRSRLPFGFRRPEMGELPQIVQHHVEAETLQIPDEPFPMLAADQKCSAAAGESEALLG
jgi:hypothetical protein